MTMETYHWERKHQSDPPVSVSIVRTLPNGDWTVRSDDMTLPAEFPTRYETLKAAMTAADEIAITYFQHDCAESGCGKWMPLPPTHNLASGSGPRADHRLTGLTRSLASGLAGAVALTAIHQLAQRRIDNAPRMDIVAMRGVRKVLHDSYDSRRVHDLALVGDLVSNSLYYSVIPAPTRRATWMRAAVLGTAAGVAALALPERIGLGAPPHSDRPANRVMTIGWYLAGAITTALVATATSGPVDLARSRSTS